MFGCRLGSVLFATPEDRALGVSGLVSPRLAEAWSAAGGGDGRGVAIFLANPFLPNPRIMGNYREINPLLWPQDSA